MKHQITVDKFMSTQLLLQYNLVTIGYLVHFAKKISTPDLVMTVQERGKSKSMAMTHCYFSDLYFHQVLTDEFNDTCH